MHPRSLPSRCCGLIALLLVVSSLSACRTSGVTNSGEVRVEVPPSVLGIDDEIDVKVYLEDSLSGRFRVDGQGKINFPLLGTVEVLGLTATQVASTLRAGLLDGFLRDPQVSVAVTEFNSRQVSVIGEVNQPGRYSYRDGMTLIQAIAEAGGTTNQALLSSMQVTRTVITAAQASTERYEVAFKDITMGREDDFQLMPGDVVLVQESAVR
ncbi:MAG: polysaccharide biosynthesis/export family protein [Myxococcota bacterium]|nr:polysaccharide biosynthesis/export family protein [Myxococcota bacterium]